MIDYPIVFRCCECTVEEQTMDHLESHIWSRHLQAFPYKCSYCDFPAISTASLMEHFEHNHAGVSAIEFKRNLEDEKRFRKMVADSIVIEYDNSQQDGNSQMDSLQPLMHQGTAQLMIIPPQNSRYGNIVEHTVTDNDDFGVMDDDENVEDLIDDDDGEYLDELGDPVFIGADEDPSFLIENDLSEESPLPPSNSYHLKYLRTRRIDKLINNVVVNAAQRTSPDSTSNTADCSFANEDNEKNKEYRCRQCSRSFKYQSKLEEHERIHLGVRPFSCPYCNRDFSQKGALKTHMRLHTGERPFYCQWDCGKHFTSSSARRHHEKTHSGERPYQCNVCGKSFTKNSHVVRHLKNIHNKDFMQETMLQGVVSSSEEPRDIIDMEPRGKEMSVVRDIVEQIHEEKFSEQKGFIRI